MNNSAFVLPLLGLALAACGSGVDQAKQEFVDSCFSSGNGRLTESECSCMADEAFASLNDEERDFVGRLSQLDRGIPDEEAAEELGMESSEFRRLAQSYMGKVQDSAIGAARQCVGA